MPNGMRRRGFLYWREIPDILSMSEEDQGVWFQLPEIARHIVSLSSELTSPHPVESRRLWRSIGIGGRVRAVSAILNLSTMTLYVAPLSSIPHEVTLIEIPSLRSMLEEPVSFPYFVESIFHCVRYAEARARGEWRRLTRPLIEADIRYEVERLMRDHYMELRDRYYDTYERICQIALRTPAREIIRVVSPYIRTP